MDRAFFNQKYGSIQKWTFKSVNDLARSCGLSFRPHSKDDLVHKTAKGYQLIGYYRDSMNCINSFSFEAATIKEIAEYLIEEYVY